MCYYSIKLLYSDSVIVKLPYDKERLLQCSGSEAFLIFIIATAWIGLSPVIAIRLGFLELMCILALIKCRNSLQFKFPFLIYSLFLVWVLIGIFYTPAPEYGVRMLLKYSYPLLVGLVAAKVVRDGDVFLACGTWSRKIATVGIILLFLPILKQFFSQILWYVASYITGLITMIIFSFAMADFTNEKKKNLIWGCLLCVPCIIMVFRTDIFGTAVALACFFIIKYRFRSVPIVAAIGLLGLCSIFYIPAVKNKMFRGKEFTMEQFMKGEVEISEKNIQMNSRGYMWRMTQYDLRKRNFAIGAGSGRVQKLFYEDVNVNDLRRGGQMHNDFLVLWLDNGYIGVALFALAYLAIFVHCIQIYRNDSNAYARMAALIAGASILGVLATCYSDNTISYSMVTLSLPWGFYGMALGMRKGKEPEEIIEIEEVRKLMEI